VSTIHLAEYRPHTKGLYFGRSDLNKLLSFYAMEVAAGRWRDYALDHEQDRAIFSLFRSAHEAPHFQIAKYRPRKGPLRYGLWSRSRELKWSRELDVILEALKNILAAL
jgi:hypothetical protein